MALDVLVNLSCPSQHDFLTRITTLQQKILIDNDESVLCIEFDPAVDHPCPIDVVSSYTNR